MFRAGPAAGVVAVGVVGALVMVAGCALGPRPTLGGPTTTTPTGSTGNDTLDAMLSRLATTNAQTFTATYAVTRRVGPITTAATVTQHPPQVAVTIGSVTFYKGPTERTCTAPANSCRDGIAEQAVSDIGVNSNFYSSSVAAQIRVSAGRRGGDMKFSVQTVVGTPADCVEIPVGSGAELYCVTQGPINVVARVRRADYTVELGSLSATVSDTVFATVP